MTEESPLRPRRLYEGDRRLLDLNTVEAILDDYPLGDLARRELSRDLREASSGGYP